MADEGASPRELLLEACRRNNVGLLNEVLDAQPSKDSIADLLNNSKDGIGNYCLHVAAFYGSYEVLDHLLDQEGLEVDPLDRMDGDTPLHKAVRFVNKLDKNEWHSGAAFVELLVDAGADPRIRNKGKLKAFDLVDPLNQELRTTLQKAEYAMTLGDDVADEDEVGDGPPSDSD
ncbi:MAG: hypothetical protein LQ340_000004 [Diploschistes diacapsis]|nr:MAG: hypothetical protein LQ340_000004 [Diploschistes diacapsis]